jgi:hypothetical protein
MKLKAFVKKIKLMNRIDRLHKARKYLLNEAKGEPSTVNCLELLRLDNGIARRVELLYKQYDGIE